MWKERAQLAASLSVGTLAIVGLHRISLRFPIDWSDPLDWLARSPIEDAVAEVIRIVALGLSYWFVVSTVLYILAVLSNIPAAIRAVEWATLPSVRRITRRVAAVTLATSMAAPAAVLLAPPAPDPSTAHPPTAGASVELTVPSTGDSLQPVVRVSDDGVVIPPGYQEPTEPAYEPTIGVPGSVSAESGNIGAARTSVDETIEQAQATTHIVVDGDNLWRISESHLAAITGVSPSSADLVAYWSAVIETNVGNLVSGDPDLIYPGEVLVLPSFEGNEE